MTLHASASPQVFLLELVLPSVIEQFLEAATPAFNSLYVDLFMYSSGSEYLSDHEFSTFSSAFVCAHRLTCTLVCTYTVQLSYTVLSCS